MAYEEEEVVMEEDWEGLEETSQTKGENIYVHLCISLIDRLLAVWLNFSEEVSGSSFSLYLNRS